MYNGERESLLELSLLFSRKLSTGKDNGKISWSHFYLLSGYIFFS